MRGVRMHPSQSFFAEEVVLAQALINLKSLVQALVPVVNLI